MDVASTGKGARASPRFSVKGTCRDWCPQIDGGGGKGTECKEKLLREPYGLVPITKMKVSRL